MVYTEVAPELFYKKGEIFEKIILTGKLRYNDSTPFLFSTYTPSHLWLPPSLALFSPSFLSCIHIHTPTNMMTDVFPFFGPLHFSLLPSLQPLDFPFALGWSMRGNWLCRALAHAVPDTIHSEQRGSSGSACLSLYRLWLYPLPFPSRAPPRRTDFLCP